MKEINIDEKLAGQKMMRCLERYLSNAPKSFLYKMLRKKNITCNGKKVTGKESLKKGDIIRVFFSEETLTKFMRDAKALQQEYEMLQELPMKGLKVIYEDEDILIADKPYNMLSQKARENDGSANEYLSLIHISEPTRRS